MRISLLLFLLLSSATLWSQSNDAGLWMDVGLSRELNDRLEITVSPEVRFDENITRWSRLFVDVGAEYKASKNFSLQAAYRGGIGNDGVHVDGRQRMQYGVAVKEKWNDWTVQLLSRAQFSMTGGLGDADVDFTTIWRNRASLKYGGLKKTDLSSSFELFNSISAYQDLALTNWRWTAQVSRKINKKQAVSFGYLIQRDLTESPQEMDYVILVSYKVEL
jgi:hypothetical protein